MTDMFRTQILSDIQHESWAQASCLFVNEEKEFFLLEL